MVRKIQNAALDGETVQTWRRFSVNVVLTFGTRLLMLACALATSIIIARGLGAEGVGSLAVITITVALAVQLGSAGLPAASTYFVSQDRTNVLSVWSNALLFSLLVGGIMAAALLIVASLNPTLLSQLSPSLVAVAALSIPFQLISLLGLNVFLGTGQIDRYNLISALGQVLLLLNAVVVLGLLGAGLFELVSFNTSVVILTSLLVAVLIARTDRGKVKAFKLDVPMFKRMLHHGIKFHIASVSSLLILRVDLLIVNHVRGAREAGVYAVAGQMGSLITLLPAIIGTLVFQRVASEPDSQGGFTMRATRHTAFIMLFVCLAAVPVSFALPLVYGPAFRDSTIQLLILLPGVYLVGIESVMVQHFSGQGLPVAIPAFWLIALAFNLALNFVLIPPFGGAGAAAVSTLTYAIIFALVAVYFRHKTGHDLSKALLLRGDEFRDLINADRPGFFSR